MKEKNYGDIKNDNHDGMSDNQRAKAKKRAISQITITIMAVVALLLVAAGISYTMFSYAKVGELENILETGGITFLYQENSNVGNGLSIINAFPVSDLDGKVLDNNERIFDFTVNASTTDVNPIDYEITLRRDNTSTLSGDYVKVYLTEIDNEEIETPLTVTKTGIVKKFNELTETTLSVGVDEKGNKFDERTIYLGTTSTNKKSFEKKFRLRIWMADDTDYTPLKNADGTYKLDETGNYIYPTTYKSFTIKINVYAKAD